MKKSTENNMVKTADHKRDQQNDDNESMKNADLSDADDTDFPGPEEQDTFNSEVNQGIQQIEKCTQNLTIASYDEVKNYEGKCIPQNTNHDNNSLCNALIIFLNDNSQLDVTIYLGD